MSDDLPPGPESTSRPASTGGPESTDSLDSTEALQNGVDRFAHRKLIRLPARHNPKLGELVARVNQDPEIYALWVATNVNAVERLHMTDHGPVHVQIVANSALRILRLLLAAGVTPNLVRDYGLTDHDAEVCVCLAALLHDVGMSIHREGHETYSLFVATPILKSLLADLYEPPLDTVLRSEVLHAIESHRSGGMPLTVEAGVLRIADALDMAQGRSRIPFEAGSTSIHSVSAAAIEAVHIEPDDERGVRIRVEMSNSAGVFQVDDLLRKKLRGSGLEEYLLVEAVIEGETEKPLVKRFQL
jgi:metal-dependent HD superfamily phosphatase/phosphodiesterase